MENYIQWKLVGGKKYLKKDVIPHKFDSQDDWKWKFTSIPHSTAVKYSWMKLVKAAEQEIVVRVRDIEIVEREEGC